MGIQIKNVSKSFGSVKVLKDISVDIKSGELIALLGPSGSGKTTLLRILAGLEGLDEGTILFDGEDITNVSPKERKIGFVFQHYALFRHMNVFENVAYGLKVRPRKTRPSKKEIERKVNELLSLVKLENFQDRYPSQLSGGQRQRVALARALAVEPKVLLLDEPFGALDAKVRKELRRWLRQLHNEFHVTSIFVTHDQEEALDVADRIIVMNNGKIEQIGTPDEVYENPKSPFVYDFLGNVNIFRGRLQNGKLKQGQFEINAPHYLDSHDDAVGYARPHDILIEKEQVDNETVPAKISFIHIVGPTARIELKREDNGEYLEAELPKEQFKNLQIQKGEVVYVRPKQLKVFIPEDFSI
ncbi:sulfate/molybdate ABC transporter ATP-binding protein [Ureibacillus sp. FSL K6-8385]|uniref:Sulfate/molybdate ABC transporter ATP-binding protein n=1 Tax=Ureibacillus terrenus TaxID=118246 RepID=A0A540V0M2_9BACL|nr:sulfate/molybdate ABC transporter ATP-binding protein [Ureibacillus terrenus]MED3662378.1 sulfate/molybdate ABC transporter ATP-binding protein [Ureibacillus terrenus]MED3763733.1 sulfate/molybdate ABC transporter ATP-binding protein [Ureibacillus terrenus]TQE90285.1 sulfate/molybdate ABC transporter ATP-binding protein [Ureibacillus terrenus]